MQDIRKENANQPCQSNWDLKQQKIVKADFGQDLIQVNLIKMLYFGSMETDHVISETVL